MLNGFKVAVLAATAIALAVAPSALAQDADRPERIGDEPNLNGIWQAMNSANWNLEPHPAAAIEQFSRELGAIAAVPAGRGVVDGGEIPYQPDALSQRDENRANWPAADPEAKCYLPGIPRATYLPHPFQIVQGGGDILMVYEYAATNRVINMTEHSEPPIDTWMGVSNGSWDGDTLVVETTGLNGESWLDRAGNYASAAATVTERFTPQGDNILLYEATIEDPETFTEAWTISMPLYRHVEPDAQLLEFRCVPFSELMLYGDLLLEEDE